MPSPVLPLTHFDYPLPPNRIAAEPLENREHSKLLVVSRSHASLSHTHFGELAHHLPPRARLVLNNTRVIPARLGLQKATGAQVEMLLLEPLAPSVDPLVALTAVGRARWRCVLSGRKVVPGTVLTRALVSGTLVVTVVQRMETLAVVDLEWPASSGALGDLLAVVGSTPLPPYIKRVARPQDAGRYQTVYARHDGSVAAPTAGLHFTPALLETLAAPAVLFSWLTLHVGAGTFRPVTTANAAHHLMHAERATITVATLEELLTDVADGRVIIPVGTTSLRTLESAHWMGARLLAGEDISNGTLLQWDWQRLAAMGDWNPAQTLGALRAWLRQGGMSEWVMETALMIIPGYPFALARGLVTNFHQPKSTLIMLVAAFLGGELWRTAYETALAGQYRFLSYGDATLLQGWE